MYLVVDPNVILSASLGIGDSLNIFCINSIIQNFKFIAPEFLYVEIGKHTIEIAERSNFSQDNASKILNFITSQIEFISEEKYKDKIREARAILKDHEKDSPYLSLALKFECKMLSGDKRLKSLCPGVVITPKELLAEFYLS